MLAVPAKGDSALWHQRLADVNMLKLGRRLVEWPTWAHFWFCVFPCLSLTVLTTLVTYIGLSSFGSVDISGLGTVAAVQAVSV
jgi:nitrate reductase NapE component